MLLEAAILKLDGATRIETPAGEGYFDVVWVENETQIAHGHYGMGEHHVTIGHSQFLGRPAVALLSCGTLVTEEPSVALFDQNGERTKHHNVFNSKCGDCPHPVHLGICTHTIDGRKCGCEYVGPS